MSKLTHIDSAGQARMVDVGEKPATQRRARASGRIEMAGATLDLIATGSHKKGDVIAVARIAGIMAAKKTAELVPLCHPIALTRVEVDLVARPEMTPPCVECSASAETVGPTGVEIEALTAVQIALLTIYDMCKAVDRGMVIADVRLEHKSGGRSGEWQRESSD